MQRFTAIVKPRGGPVDVCLVIKQRLDELELDDRQKQRAKAQIAILTTECSGELDRAIVYQAGHTLRNITEGAIGSLLATAAQPTVWIWIHQMLSKFG